MLRIKILLVTILILSDLLCRKKNSPVHSINDQIHWKFKNKTTNYDSETTFKLDFKAIDKLELLSPTQLHLLKGNSYLGLDFY
jgi:hypothetical protein